MSPFRKERAARPVTEDRLPDIGGEATPYIAEMALQQGAAGSAGICAGQKEQRSADARLRLQALTDTHDQVATDLFCLGRLAELRASESSIGEWRRYAPTKVSPSRSGELQPKHGSAQTPQHTAC